MKQTIIITLLSLLFIGCEDKQITMQDVEKLNSHQSRLKKT